MNSFLVLVCLVWRRNVSYSRKRTQTELPGKTHTSLQLQLETSSKGWMLDVGEEHDLQVSLQAQECSGSFGGVVTVSSNLWQGGQGVPFVHSDKIFFTTIPRPHIKLVKVSPNAVVGRSSDVPRMVGVSRIFSWEVGGGNACFRGTLQVHIWVISTEKKYKYNSRRTVAVCSTPNTVSIITAFR